MTGNEERLSRPHVVRRIAEISDASEDGRPGKLVTSTAAQRIRNFESYVRYVKDKPEPKTMSDKDLVEAHECFIMDVCRYSQWGSEHNFAIIALAVEWQRDIGQEMLRRMKAV